jgi:hypothetical protein
MLRIRYASRPSLWYSLVVVFLVATGFTIGHHPTVGVQPDGSILTPVARD